MDVRNRIGIAVAMMLGGVSFPVLGADSPAKESGFVSIKAADIKWTDAPSIGPGAKIAILEGDLKAAAPFTMRIKIPANFTIGVHTHPAVERVTVLAGSFYFATGDKFDTAKATPYRIGDGFIVPIGIPMYAFTRNEESIIQLHGVGPWGIHYLNPADQPKTKK